MKLNELLALGQSIWYDNISRELLNSGAIARLIEQGLRGMTSNPTIFEKAIQGGGPYDEALTYLMQETQDPMALYETMAIEDIQRAADLLRPVYEESNGLDGYISLEVSPKLAHDTEGTLAAARDYLARVNRPNLMIKIPATRAGIPAIEQAISEGININATLMFSLGHYEAVANAFINGLETRLTNGQDVSGIASVASFFVSRVDSKVDNLLEEKGNTSLQGKIAIANAKVTYQRFKELFRSERWEKLATNAAQVQRPLWASTSTKNPDYPDTYYVDELIGQHTVNTVPHNTLEAIMDHGTAKATLENNLKESQQQLAELADLGINLDQVTEELQDEGVDKFGQSFDSLLDTIKQRLEVVRN